MVLVNDEKKIKVLLKGCDLDEIDDIIFKLKNERRQIAARLTAKEQQHRKADKEQKSLRDQALQKVIDFAESVKEQNQLSQDFEFVIALKKKKFSRPPKYQYIDEDGSTKTWAGVGRKPKPIQDALDNGSSLDEFLIE